MAQMQAVHKNATSTTADLTGLVALVTGGGRGLGQRFAQALAAAGAAVAVSARTEAELAETVEGIERGGGRAAAVTADVTDRRAVERTVAAVERRLGPIDVLVNNAGRFQALGPLWEVDPDNWWREQEVNLRGPLLCTRAVLPGMLARGRGRIINVASGAGALTRPGASAYSVSKTALLRLTDTLARELDGRAVTVFAIHPGTVRTPMNDHVLQAHADALKQWAPWFRKVFVEGRDDPPEPAARLVVALASGRADALSGRFITVRDDLDDLIARADAIARDDLHVLRLRL
jgi:NAD(P)-dependent dehydrogenase (short-subunit alcohol dehydrogenase family)